MIRRLRSMLAGAAIVVMAWGGAPGASAAPLPSTPTAPPAAQAAPTVTRPTAQTYTSDQCQPASARWTATGNVHSSPPSTPIKLSDLPAVLNGGAAPSQTQISPQCDAHSSVKNVAEAISKATQQRIKSNKQFLPKGQKAKRITEGYKVVKTPAARAAQSKAQPMASGVYIKGMVTDADDSPLTGIQVDIFDADMVWVGNAITSGGNYNVEVDPGSYYVGFTDTGSGVNASGWWSSGGFVYQEVDADTVTVAGLDVTANVKLPDALHVQGTADGSSTHNGIRVWLLSATGGIAYDNEAGGGTDSLGDWQIAVAPGTYYVYTYDLDDRYGDVFWTHTGPVYDIAAAETITVTSTSVTANMTLPDALFILGTLYQSDGYGGYSPISDGISVYAWYADGDQAGNDSTDSSGTYSIKVIPGSYIVGFFDDQNPDGPTFGSGYFTWNPGAEGFTYYLATASTVDVGSNSQIANATLPLGVVITGTMTGSTPSGSINNVGVYADDLNQTYPAYGDSNGMTVNWEIAVPPGTYIIRYEDSDYSNPLYAAGYYSASGFTYDDRSATLVTVLATDVSTRALTVPKAPRIRGTVSEGGAGANDVTVSADDVAGRSFQTATNPDGTYSLPVAPGTYTLYFSSDSYASGYYNSSAAGNYVASQGVASTITVGSSDVPNKNVTLPAALLISGRVRSGTDWLDNIQVSLFEIEPDGNSRQTWTDSNGAYSFRVAAGTYALQFMDPTTQWSETGHATGYYKNGASGNFGYDRASETEVAVTTSDVGVPNVTLPNALYIKGKITRTKGVGIGGIDVAVYSNNPDYAERVGGTSTNFDGTYFVAVPPGRYKIGLSDMSQTYGSGYYSSTGFQWYWKDAGLVTVQGSDLTGVNVELPSGNRISGTITHGVGAPVTARVEVSSSEGVFYDFIDTDQFGFYSLSVPSGTYNVHVFDESGWFASGYFDTGAIGNFSYAVGDATPIPIAGDDASGINVNLPSAYHIVGKVSKSGGAGVDNIEVLANGNESYWANTKLDGTYSVAVAPGPYQLSFNDPMGKLGSGWLGTSGFTYDPAKAATVQVSAADVIRNVTLPNALHIKGKISRAGGTVPYAEVIAIGSTRTFFARTYTDGTYSVPVAPGTYKLLFVDEWGLWGSGYYSTSGFQYRESRATSVTVSTADVTGKNVTLPAGKFIEGLVTDASGVGLDAIQVYAICPDFSNTTATDLDGSYFIEVEQSGCEIGFYDRSGKYATGYRGASGFTYFEKLAAKPTVSGARLAGQDVTLPEAIYVKGTVRDGSATPLHWVTVDVGSTNGMYGNWAITDDAGKYSVEVAPDLSYDMFFSDLTGTNGRGYRVSAGTLVYDLASADAVPVAEADVSPVDVTMSAASYLVFPSASYHAIEPRRILDTRPNNGAIVNVGLSGKFSSGFAREFGVAGANYVGGGWSAAIPPNAIAVTGNLTITAPKANATFTVGPTATGLTNTISISFAKGETRANNVTVGLAPDGGLWAGLTNTAAGNSIDVIFDVTGYFLPNTVGASYTPVDPGRILDSRNTSGGIINIGLKGKFTNGTVRTFNVAGVTPVGGTGALVPLNATAVSGNLTVTNATSGGFLSVGPSMASVPSTSTLNTDKGFNRANGVMVALNNGQLQAVWNGASGSSADAVFDVTGYFTNDSSGMLYHPIEPVNAIYPPNGFPARTPIPTTILYGKVDANARGVSGNLTVVKPSASGFAFISPTAVAVPKSSTVNVDRGMQVSNGINVACDPGGSGNVTIIWWSNPGTYANMRLDITGYWK